jgi:hypothetical protein
LRRRSLSLRQPGRAGRSLTTTAWCLGALTAISLIVAPAVAGAARLNRGQGVGEVAKSPAAAPRSTAATVGQPLTVVTPGTESPALSVWDPIAQTASLNPVVPEFTLTVVSYRQVSVGVPRLKKMILAPVSRAASIKGGCSQCGGSGRFLPYIHKGNGVVEPTVGTVHLTSRTRIVWAAVRSGEIGRYKLYGFNPGLNAVPQQVLLSEGCLAADFVQDSGPTSLGLLGQLLHPRTLPRVPCSGTPRGDSATFYEPGPELSPSTRLPGHFSGSAGGSRWLSVFQAGSGNCARDPLGEARRTSNHLFWHITGGKFRRNFVSGLVKRPGNFCAYLQTGGRYRGIPDGRVGIRWSAPYFGGDTVSITGVTTGVAGQPVVDTFSGFASAKETLWTFDSASPCAATAEAEYPPAVGVGDNAVNGSFSLSISSVPLATSSYRCAYLQAGAPSAGKPTGPTLAAASALITVS